LEQPAGEDQSEANWQKRFDIAAAFY